MIDVAPTILEVAKLPAPTFVNGVMQEPLHGVSMMYSFDQDFAKLNSRLVFQPGQGLVVPAKHSTWAAYWSAWQYLFTEHPGNLPIDLLNGEPDQQGVGTFVRFGFSDKDTNPTEWAVSGGLGGRGVIPSRDNDTFGLGYYYNSIQQTRLFSALGVENSVQGFEGFYNIALTPACHVTVDLQIVEPVAKGVHSATILGLRASLDF